MQLGVGLGLPVPHRINALSPALHLDENQAFYVLV